jgi:hypothetical protein
VVVLQGRGPSQQDGPAGDAGDHGPAGRRGRHVLHGQPQRVVRAGSVIHQAEVGARVLQEVMSCRHLCTVFFEMRTHGVTLQLSL